MNTNEFNITVIEAMKLAAYKRIDRAHEDPKISKEFEFGMIAGYNNAIKQLRKNDEN